MASNAPDIATPRRPRSLVSLADLARFNAIIDVRSPAEYAEDHIPGALNHPVLSNEERAEIGTLYKQVSPFVAKKRGAALVSANIAQHLLEHWQEKEKNWRPLVYCWRGGQRSGALVTILRSIGWEAGQLEGGYKAFRTQVVADLETLPQGLDMRILMGSTGSAKTRILQAIAEMGGQVLDLETLACHKGSVLGALPHQPQPSQKSFETALWQALQQLDRSKPVHVEAESPKIGTLQVPGALLQAMHGGTCIAIEATLEARVQFLQQDYDYARSNPDWLARRLDSLRPLRGHALVNQWQEWITQQKFVELTESLLTAHYDPLYAASLARHFGPPAHTPTLTSDDLSPAGIRHLAQQILELPR